MCTDMSSTTSAICRGITRGNSQELHVAVVVAAAADSPLQSPPSVPLPQMVDACAENGRRRCAHMRYKRGVMHNRLSKAIGGS